MSNSFIHLHLHSEYSISDSLIRIEELIDHVSKNKSPAVAITDNNNIFSLIKFYKTAIRNGEFNPVTAKFDTEPLTVAVSGGWNLLAGVDNSATLIASGTDDAANPTQAVPGELVYMDGDSDPTQDEYKPRTNW